MKYFFWFLFLLPVLIQAQTNHYISSSYNGANGKSNGTINRPYTSWSQVPALSPGDSVLFRRGDVFPLNSPLVIRQSGTPAKRIYIGAYGTGAKPVISGLSTITNWTSAGNGLYWISVSNDPNTVLFNGVMRGKGRYPKAAYSFLTYTSSNEALGTITDPKLPTSTSWVGATAVIRTGGIQWQRRTVTAQSNGTLTLNTGDSYNNGYGYFFQDHPKACTQLGDWYYDGTTNRLYMYFGTEEPSNHGVKVPTVKDCISIPSRNSITVENIIVEGAIGNNIAIGNTCKYIIVRNCEVRYSFQGIAASGASKDCILRNNYVHHAANKGICGPMSSANYLIEGNLIEDVGMIHGAGATGNSSYSAIYFEGGEGFTIRRNRINRCGYSGIRAARGNNILIEENVIDSYGWVKDDNGGISFWAASTDPVYTNRIVRRNIIRGARTEGAIGANGAKRQHGLYTDTRTQNVLFEGNIVINPYGYGYLNNTGFNNITLKDNIFFGCQRAGLRYELRNDSIGAYRNMNVTGNIITCTAGAKGIAVLTPASDFAQMGTFANNYYRTSSAETIESQVKGQRASTKTLSQWQSAYGLETGSKWELDDNKETRLEYNDTDVKKAISLKGKTYKNLKTGAKVSGKITLQPFEGVVLVSQ